MVEPLEFEQRYSNCFLDFAMKTGTGFVIGGMIATWFLKARRWPILLGSGMGFGMAYMNCENSLNDYLLSMDSKKSNIKKGA